MTSFYVEGAINGHPVTFMVDTGATVVSVSEDLARKIGLGPGVPAIFDTAAGRVEGRIVPAASVQVGVIRVEGIRVGINNGGPSALLGQNFLNKKFLKQWQGLYHVVFLDWFAKELGCCM